MDTTTLVVGLAALALLVFSFTRDRSLPLAGLLTAGRTLWHNGLLLLFGFILAGMVQVLVPHEWITRFLGAESGLKGVLTACVIGGVMPGAPYAVFPLIGALYKGGAGLGPVISFSTAWSLWSLSRLPVEMALIDPKAAFIRYGITFLVPPAAGLLANVIGRLI